MTDNNFSHSYIQKVEKSDIDELGHVNNVVYVQWIQDAAVKHWNKVAPEEVKKDFVWVIVRHEIDYKASAKMQDELLIKTKVLNAEGVSSRRLVQIYRNADMRLLVESVTNWIMVNAKTFRPARIPDSVKESFLPGESNKS